MIKKVINKILKNTGWFPESWIYKILLCLYFLIIWDDFMKKLIQIFYAFVMVMFCATLCGCTDAVENPDVTVTNTGGQGFVAFSAGCSGDSYLNLYYVLTDFNLVRMLDQNYYNTQVIVTCADSPKYFLLKLPVGKYAVGIGSDNSYVAENATPIFFIVKPGKVSYIGRFYVNVLHKEVSFSDVFWSGKTGVYYDFHLINNSEQDISYFLEKYKNISKDQYDVNMAIMGPQRSLKNK